MKKTTIVSAFVLTNRAPPYSLSGGIFDALMGSDGECYSVTNDEAKMANSLFEEIEHTDLDPAAAVAFASVIQAAKAKSIPHNDIVMLNATGG